MGSGNRESGRQTDIYNKAGSLYPTGPSPIQTGATTAYGNALNDPAYSNIMGGYTDLYGSAPSARNFTFQSVGASRPGELNEAYGTLKGALPGYQEFASTGGYSPTDIQELRARGTSPIRAAYANAQQDLSRANTLGGGAANYIAAASKMQRQLPGQLADAETNVNAGLADAIRQGKLAGLAGETGIGSTMGGLASSEAGRQLQAALANQEADMRTQMIGYQSGQDAFRNRLGALQGMSSLYGTTPAQAALFGNQALNAQGQEQNYNLGLLNAQRGSLNQQSGSKPWWQTALGVAGAVAPYALAPFTGGASLFAAPFMGGFGGGGDSSGSYGGAAGDFA